MCAPSCLTLWDSIDCSPPGSSLHGVFQATILEWVAISFSKRSSSLRDQICVSCVAGRFFTTEPPKLFRVQCRTSFVAQLVKNLPANAEDERNAGLWIPEKIPWRRKCQSAPLFLLGKFHGKRSLADYSPWGCRIWHDWAPPHTHVNYFVFTCSRAYFMM